MKKILLTLIVAFGFLSLGLINQNTVEAQKIPTMTLFHGATCPHCINLKKWLPELQTMYPDLKINEYEVWSNPENQLLFEARMRELGQEAGGVPTNIIGEDVIVGFNKKGLIAAMEKNFGAPVVTAEEIQAQKKSWWDEITDFFKNIHIPSRSTLREIFL
jgi:glutaredoxin